MTILLMMNYSASILLSTAALVALMPTSAQAITFSSFENGFTDWDTLGNASIETAAFGSGPTDGSQQALLQTGMGSAQVFVPPPLVPTFGQGLEGQGTGTGFLFEDSQISDEGAFVQGSAIRARSTFTARTGDVLSLDFNLLSDDTINDDLAFLSLNDQLIRLASASAATSPSAGTPFLQETGYQTFSTTLTAGTYRIGLGVVDEGAAGGTSGLLVDNIELTPIPFQVHRGAIALGSVAFLLALRWRGRCRYQGRL